LLLPKLIQAVNDNQSSGRDIAALIGQDPALAGNLLRIANSPCTGCRRCRWKASNARSRWSAPTGCGR
jgi:HD-like signal output (HDOD) protein